MHMKRRILAMVAIIILSGWIGIRIQRHVEGTFAEECFRPHETLLNVLSSSVTVCCAMFLMAIVDIVFKRYERKGMS